MRIRTSFCIAGATIAALLSTEASAATVFGSRLNHQLTPPEACNANRKSDLCSWVLTIAQNRPGQQAAPRDGTVTKLRLMACGPGSFVLQVARARPATDQARVLTTGPLINYVGALHNCNGSRNFIIEEFAVNVPVRQGDYLSVVASRVAFIYNSSGDGTLTFDPPLADGGAFRTTSGTGLGSGILMMEAELAD